LSEVVSKIVSARIWLYSVPCVLVFVLPICHLEIEGLWLVLDILHFA
jgi:hypothetical protein